MLERFKVPDTDKVYIQSDKIFELTKNILKDLGVSDEGASNSASVLIENDLRGVESHGVSNGLRLYINRYLDGISIKPTIYLENGYKNIDQILLFRLLLFSSQY